MAPIDSPTDLKLKGHLSGTLGPVIAISTVTGRKSHKRGIILWYKKKEKKKFLHAAVRHTVDCIKEAPRRDLPRRAA